MARKVPIYLKINSSCDLQKSINLADSLGCKSIITKLSSDLYKRGFHGTEVTPSQQQFSRNPLAFTSATYFSDILPMIEISSLMDSTNVEIQKNYEQKVLTDINYAFHLKQIGQIYVKASCKPATLAKFLLKALEGKIQHGFIVEVDLVHKKHYQNMHFKESDEDEEIPDSWTEWNELCKATDYDTRFMAALVFSSDSPSFYDDQHVLLRWLGEAVAMVVLPAGCFTTNRINFPILSQQNRAVFKLFMAQIRCSMVIECKELNKFLASNYKDYLKQLAVPDKQEIGYYSDNYIVQYPMQPLKDDLDFAIYETFEQDKAKYVLYQKAIEAALIDMVPDESKNSKKIVILVVGAGRGPLVRCAFNASKNTKRKIKVVIIEKNRCAVNTLRAVADCLWKDKDIEIIAKDMRKVELEEKADILVSELLGSFGDNELSPECLDGAQHLLKDSGISIPSNSVSYLRPIMSRKLRKTILKTLPSVPCETRFQTSWQIYLTNAYLIDAAKENFRFVHPNKDKLSDNKRHKKLEFKAQVDCILDGFVGYFTAQLYKDIEISIHPESHTKGLISWFSIFFPLPEVMELKKGDRIELDFWRKFDTEKAWYEYQVVAPTLTKVINEGGEHHKLLL